MTFIKTIKINNKVFDEIFNYFKEISKINEDSIEDYKNYIINLSDYKFTCSDVKIDTN